MADKKPTQDPKKAVNEMFAKVGKSTGASSKKVDEWQAKWLAMPKNRAKYESIKDAPDVVSEELFAMFNDVIDFVQNQEGGQSHVFSKLKEEGKELAKDPKGFFKGIFDKGKGMADKGLEKAKDAAAGATKQVEGLKKPAHKKKK